MKKEKGLKYYAKIFLFSTIALVAYIVYLYFKADEFDITTVFSLLYVPLLFTGLLFIFDKLFDFIFPTKEKKGNLMFESYLKTVGNSIQSQCNFGIEDYKRLRNNPKFQKGLEQAFRIVENGESEEISFAFLEKKFKKETNEFIAFQVVIQEVKKMMENS